MAADLLEGDGTPTDSETFISPWPTARQFVFTELCRGQESESYQRLVLHQRMLAHCHGNQSRHPTVFDDTVHDLRVGRVLDERCQ